MSSLTIAGIQLNWREMSGKQGQSFSLETFLSRDMMCTQDIVNSILVKSVNGCTVCLVAFTNIHSAIA